MIDQGSAIQICILLYQDFFYIKIIKINILMENIVINHINRIEHDLKTVKKVCYQQASSTLVVLHSSSLTLYSYNNKNNTLEHTGTSPAIQELSSSQVLLMEWLVDNEQVLCISNDGSIFTVDPDWNVDIKAQNEDGILAATISPTQEYLYVVTKNKSIIQLNKQFDLVNEIPLDQNEEVLLGLPQFSWRADGTHFIINYQTVNGYKAVTKDQMMGTFISPAKSDPKQDGLVQSVSEKGKKQFLSLVAWQPSASIVAGVDLKIKNQVKNYRVIFWEKNGLRHLQFNLPLGVTDVKELFWSLDSSVLFVRVDSSGKEKLFLYYRANYHWFLKHTIILEKEDICLSLSCQKNKNHKILIVTHNGFQILEYVINYSQKSWKNQEKQAKDKNQFQYFIDGNIVNVTDFSKGMMPPPMSMYKHLLDSNILGISKLQSTAIVITENKISILDLLGNSVKNSIQKGQLLNKKIYGVKLISLEPLNFIANENRFTIEEEKLKKIENEQLVEQEYVFGPAESQLRFKVEYKDNCLRVNEKTLSEQCTSFIFYHEFLIFTVSTSDMYDKLFVINLQVDLFLQQQVRVKDKLAQFETKDMLNHRLIERGSKILAISEGRVVFQLPRGNLEGIYPKIIMISLVLKKINLKEYNKAFQIVRTHKLDFNLLFDLNPDQFLSEIEMVLKDIKRTDYINLLVSQIDENISSQLQYALSAKKYEIFVKDFEINMKGKKVKTICKAVSQTLRRIGKQEYILSIFTSDIKQGRLNDVLFEIKELKQNDVQVVTPPHVIKNDKKEKKKLSSQDILEYVCWLVDANAIYQAALLTYDLQLAAMTARCTQMDPKEYIPYLQSLKEIKDNIEFRRKICVDLKRFDIAVKQLSQGNEQQKKQSLALIKQYKLFKNGLTIYTGKQELIKVKQMIIQQLSASGELNEAYRVCQSIGSHDKALQIAKNLMDSKKIKQCLEIIYEDKDQRIKYATEIVDRIKDQIKSKIDLARLFAYIGRYEEAVTIYLRHNDYRKAYKYMWKVSPAFREKEMIDGFKLCFSVKRNEIIKDRKQFLEKYTRLVKVHKHKSQFGQVTSFKPRENDDMYSEVSQSSKAQSNYTISTTTGMRKKKDKKRSILTRNVKEGSLLEQQYLLAFIKSLEQKVEDAVKDAKLLIQHLICLNLIEEAEIMRNQIREYLSLFNEYRIKSFARTKFQELHPEASELYYEQKKFSNLSIDSFNYLF